MFIDYLLSAVLMLITFAIGSSLRFANFENIFKKSKPLYLGLFLQMVFLPICAFIIAELVNLPPAEKVGLIIVAICPGGTTSNFISYLIKADTALAVALTAINSLLILLSIPLLSNWAVAIFMGSHTEVSLPILNMVWEVAKIIIIPALLGLFLKTFKLSGVQATTISIEVGLQNTALAILVAGTLIGNTDMTKPALVYAIFSFFTTFIFALITIRLKR